MISLYTGLALLVISCACVADDTCQSQLPSGVDSSICDEIQSAVFVFRYAVRGIDEKVKETVLVAIKEAREILDSTSATTIEDVKSALSGTRRRRSESTDLSSVARSLANEAVKNIEIAIRLAERKIRSSIALAVSATNIKNDKLKTEAVELLKKMFSKRSTGFEPELVRRDLQSDIQSALAAASEEVKKAMKEAVTTSIHEYRKIMDYFARLLKQLFQRANLKGDVDQAEQDIEQLAINASIGFIKFYDSFSKVTIGRAIRSVEELLLKVYNIGKTNPNALIFLKSLLQQAIRKVSEVVAETTTDPDDKIRQAITGAAEKMLKDYQTVEAILKKNGI